MEVSHHVIAHLHYIRHCFTFVHFITEEHVCLFGLDNEAPICGPNSVEAAWLRCRLSSISLTRGSPHLGWMTFAPEWLTGSPNLDTSNWMYL